MKTKLILGFSAMLLFQVGCNEEDGTTKGEPGDNTIQCDDFLDEASPGNIVFRIKNQRATPIHYDDNGECFRAFSVGEGDAQPKSPGITGEPTCDWYMKNAGTGPLDCLTNETSTIEPGASVDLTWNGLVREAHELPVVCRGSADQFGSCDQLVALKGELTVHFQYYNTKECSGLCTVSDGELKQQPFSLPSTAPVEIVIE